MSAQNAFRSIVGLSLALAIIAAISGQFAANVPEDWKTVLEWNGQGGVFEYVTSNLPEGNIERIGLLLLALVFLAFAVAVQIGMFLFWRFARAGYVILTGVFVLLTAFDGLVVTVPAEASLYELTLVLDGVIIAMSYLRPIAGYFEGQNV